MKSKLSRIRSPLRRLLITALVNSLLLLARLSSPRARAHWLGNAGRPRRRERLLFLAILPVAVFILEPHQFALWAVGWGSFFAVTVNLYLMLYLARVVNKRDQ